MQSLRLAAICSTLALGAYGGSPVGKVLSMISDLEAGVIKEGETSQKEYEEFSEWCEDSARTLGFEIKTGNSESETLKASIADELATIESLQSKVDDLTSSIATDESDLKAATQIRAKENKNFLAEEGNLVETIDMLGRATGILEREMSGGASMLQNNAGSLADAFAVMLQASQISAADAAKLTAFVQDAQQSKMEDTSDAPGAPAAAVYESHSGNIVDTLQDLSEKAEGLLKAARNKETASLNNFQMLKQSLEDELRFANNDLDDAKQGIAASTERKASAKGELDVTVKELASDEQSKADLHHSCMTKASTFEAETRSRGEELKALAEAKKIIKEATGASALVQESFLQMSRSGEASGAHLANLQAVRLIRDLARKEKSGSLMQLASRISSAMHSHDAFGKIKGLISDMIAKLEAEAGADATKKAYCDKELSETNTKKSDKNDEIKKITTLIDRKAAKSAQLKEDVAALEMELSKLAKSQAEMDRLRAEEKAAFDEASAELSKGLKGIKLALKVLNDYYAADKSHNSADGAASGIIGLLEVCEADFSKNLAQATSDEEAAVSEYEQTTKDNEIDKTSKNQDVKYKVQESKSLDKAIGELTADRAGVQTELDAVLEYLSKIESECIAKAETYATRKARHEAEIGGLKAALQILESETALVQTAVRRHSLRGDAVH